MDTYMVYLILKLSDFQVLLVMTAILSGIAAVVCGVVYIICKNEAEHGIDTEENRVYIDAAVYFLKRSVVCCLLSTIVVTLMPNTKQAAAMYLIPRLTQGETMQTISDKGMKLLEAKYNQLLDEYTESKE